MIGEEYAKILKKKNAKKAKTEAKESEWPDMDPKKASEIKEYVKTATFSEIMGSKQHRRNTEQLTYQTTSKKLCYWCLTASCLAVRTRSLPKNKNLPRVELDGMTMSMCAV